MPRSLTIALAQTGAVLSEAIGDGYRAVHHFANVQAHQLEDENDESDDLGAKTHGDKAQQGIEFSKLNTRYFAKAARLDPPVRSTPERLNDSEEIELGVELAAVKSESQRCFSCGQCMSCDNCWNYCPDASVLVSDDANHPYVIDFDYCKGCGICVNECPVGYIQLIDEE